jgi:hypothetical protein
MNVILKVNKIIDGQVLWASCENILISKGFNIFQSNDHGETWKLRWTIPIQNWKSVFVHIRLTARLLRQEIRTFCLLSDRTGVAVTKSGIFRGEPESPLMDFVMQPINGTPLNIMVDKQNRVFFGDYGFNGVKSIYVSFDKAKTFEVIKQFNPNEIRHVHGIQEDPFDSGYWIFTGDYENQSGIARLSPDLKYFDWVYRNSQQVRLVQAIIESDCLYYGTDSNVENNYIVRFDKSSCQPELLCPISGASLFATRFGKMRLISTSVDPTTKTKDVILYGKYGDDGHWNELITYRKDFWNPKYFQYGTLIFPRTNSETIWGVYSGKAVDGFDNKTAIVTWSFKQ